MMNFQGKVVLITGATGGLGQNVAKAFAEKGATLVLTGRKQATLEELFADWQTDHELLLLAADVTDEASVQNLVGGVLEKYGRIDILCNIAGGFTMGPPVHETPLQTWEFMLTLNAKSTFLMCRAVIPSMLENGFGKIVNVAAVAGLNGRAKMAPYSISKSAVIRLTESMAAELKGSGINVNCILPGTIDTPTNRENMPKADHSKWIAPRDLANVMFFLSSDLGTAVHGAIIPVTGVQ